MYQKIKALFVLALALSIFSCDNKPDQSIEYVIKDVKFNLEAPLLEGSNEVQAEVPFAPEEVLKASGLTRENIQDIRVKNVKLDNTSQENFNLFESLLVQLVGGEQGLTTVASLTSIPKGVKQLEPQTTENVSLKELKKAQSFYWVNDVNLSQGSEEDIMLEGDIVFQLDVKK